MPNVPAPSNNHVRDDFSNDREPIASFRVGVVPNNQVHARKRRF